MEKEPDVMMIALDIIPILQKEKLTYNQAKKVLECCEFLLGDYSVMIPKESKICEDIADSVSE